MGEPSTSNGFVREPVHSERLCTVAVTSKSRERPLSRETLSAPCAAGLV
jgi:hypothetical protein